MTIAFPFKRVFGLLGATRTGKDSVANFLSETRDFAQIAFADQIKEEFGISKEDFEVAKIAGNIEELRNKLWTFSAKKKKEDPKYFIKKVIKKANQSEQSIIITDIRTEEELVAFYNIESRIKRVYWVRGDFEKETDDKGRINGSEFFRSAIANQQMTYSAENGMRAIYNDKNGLYAFYQELDKFFFAEDVEDIWNDTVLRCNIRTYLNQFEIKLKERVM